MLIIEPKPVEREDWADWREREIFKLTHNYSKYCDPDLHSYIGPINSEYQNYINACQQQIF